MLKEGVTTRTCLAIIILNKKNIHLHVSTHYAKKIKIYNDTFPCAYVHLYFSYYSAIDMFTL